MSASKITGEVLRAFLSCKYKAYLKEVGEQGCKTDYETLLLSRRDEVKRSSIEKVLTSHGEGEVARDVPLTEATLKSGPAFILDALFEDDLFCLKLDGLKRIARLLVQRQLECILRILSDEKPPLLVGRRLHNQGVLGPKTRVAARGARRR